MKFAEPFNDPGVLLRHHVDGLEYEHQREDEKDEGNASETEHSVFHSEPDLVGVACAG